MRIERRFRKVEPWEKRYWHNPIPRSHYQYRATGPRFESAWQSSVAEAVSDYRRLSTDIIVRRLRARWTLFLKREHLTETRSNSGAFFLVDAE